MSPPIFSAWQGLRGRFEYFVHSRRPSVFYVWHRPLHRCHRRSPPWRIHRHSGSSRESLLHRGLFCSAYDAFGLAIRNVWFWGKSVIVCTLCTFVKSEWRCINVQFFQWKLETGPNNKPEKSSAVFAEFTFWCKHLQLLVTAPRLQLLLVSLSSYCSDQRLGLSLSHPIAFHGTYHFGILNCTYRIWPCTWYATSVERISGDGKPRLFSIQTMPLAHIITIATIPGHWVFNKRLTVLPPSIVPFKFFNSFFTIFNKISGIWWLLNPASMSS